MARAKVKSSSLQSFLESKSPDWLKYDEGASGSLDDLEGKGVDRGRLLRLLNQYHLLVPYVRGGDDSEFARRMGLAQRSLARTVKSLRSLRDSPAGLVVTAQMWEDIPRIATYLSDLEALIKAAKKRAAEDIVRARITAMAVTQPGEYNDNSIGELIDAARRDGAKTKARFQQRDEQRAAARRRKRAGDAQKHWRLIHDRLVRTEVGDVGTFQAAKELMVELKRIEGEQRAAEIAASEEKPR